MGVGSRADADDVLFENAEGNNTRARLIYVGPDLVVSSFTAPTSGVAGGTVTLGDTVKNQGGTAAGPLGSAAWLRVAVPHSAGVPNFESAASQEWSNSAKRP